MTYNNNNNNLPKEGIISIDSGEFKLNELVVYFERTKLNYNIKFTLMPTNYFVMHINFPTFQCINMSFIDEIMKFVQVLWINPDRGITLDCISWIEYKKQEREREKEKQNAKQV